MTTIAILSPGFPSIPGGVTDHTHRLVAHWSAAGHVVRVIGTATPATAAANGADALLIQYVPFLYGRRGLSTVPETLARKAAAKGTRVTVFVHEPWVPMTRLPWLVLGPLQRRQLLRLTAVAHEVVTAVPAWQSKLGRRAQLLYVGSNLGAPSTSDVTSRLPSPVVFSPTAAGLRFDWIARASEAIGASPGLILVGSDARDGREHPQLAPWFDASWDWRGRLPAPEVLRVLAGARVVLAPFVDGATGRRGSLLAALSTGARVVSSTGPLADPIFQKSPVQLAGSESDFIERAVRTWHAPDTPSERDARLKWYRASLDPADLDARLLRLVTTA